MNSSIAMALMSPVLTKFQSVLMGVWLTGRSFTRMLIGFDNCIARYIFVGGVAGARKGMVFFHKGGGLRRIRAINLVCLHEFY